MISWTLLDWAFVLSCAAAGAAVGWALADRIMRRRSDRAAIERRLTEWAG